MEKHSHKFADKVKPGEATIQSLHCPKCNKIIVKGRNTGKGFGVAKVLGTHVHGKDFVIRSR